MRPRRHEEGSATVAAAGMVVALVSLLGVIVGAASQVVAAHRAQVAADMAAVAGAWEAFGSGAACQEASRVAAANGAQMRSCAREGADVVVTATVGRRHATSRAGPL
ncbi:Rv3654c family TadE-like protein [Corynebacterium uberis]|uniref:Rv3654c family TadE-like protein n=1 Tax=Corynebacterium TaxID=1716 RepID=UPI001D0BD625|nr:Rv3654c family TadE-like protein [Corynebacterium uberis]MCZ9309960.1 flp pilus-assembly TadE/G-like family protein [Corynebacterium sp. c6VSa_13]UDL73121.1 flp pilus-assembly TadE/G-like family protein [Corynebacterium uberis]UDL76002.1 flp pilus-assembly TadE/G-like family protein [Corynebacterium uberis]UDL78214.1 flp pilus-assembly TadE/G-like family protein [Corynebacterium uberis]UDL80497.1 flp pilus-assembly TadE/G-like family protein [Corynebacterium uberis]